MCGLEGGCPPLSLCSFEPSFKKCPTFCILPINFHLSDQFLLPQMDRGWEHRRRGTEGERPTAVDAWISAMRKSLSRKLTRKQKSFNSEPSERTNHFSIARLRDRRGNSSLLMNSKQYNLHLLHNVKRVVFASFSSGYKRVP